MAEHRLTDDTPTRADVDQAREVERTVAEQTYQEAADRLPRRVKGLAEVTAARVSRRYGVIALIVAFLVPTLFSLAAYSRSGEARDTAISTQRTVDAALDRLDVANDTLTARGQTPVPAPVSADPTAAVAAAVLAQVLASLPPSPTADDVAARIQGAVIASLEGPSMNELARLAADYFEANPPIPGPAPSEAAIQAAVDRAYSANPPANGVDGESPPCLSTPAMCEGDDGADGMNGLDGDDGRSVLTGPEPVRLDNGDCVFRVTYDREPLVVDYPAGNSVCPGGGVIGLDR